MSRQRSVLVLIIVPSIVSLLVTMLVLWVWDSQREPVTHVFPTTSPTSQVPPLRLPTESEVSGSVDVGEQSAEVIIEPPPEEETSCLNPVHMVESGDTISGLSVQYGVAVDDIVVANPDLPNPDSLSVGQELLIPVCGLPTPVPTLTPSATPIPTPIIPSPIPTPLPLPTGEVHLEISAVLNPRDVTSEAVVITNLGSRIDLEGWTLSDEDGNVFTFPSVQLFHGEVTVYTGVGENTPIDLYWGLSQAVWELGETVSLSDQTGALQASYEISTE